jgi:hypothetical protein
MRGDRGWLLGRKSDEKAMITRSGGVGGTVRPIERRGGLLIGVGGIQTDGVTYQLEPSAICRLEDVPANTPRLRSVFLGHKRTDDFETMDAPYWLLVAQMLTGLTVERLKEFAPIRIISHGQQRIVWEWQPEGVSSPR